MAKKNEGRLPNRRPPLRGREREQEAMLLGSADRNIGGARKGTSREAVKKRTHSLESTRAAFARSSGGLCRPALAQSNSEQRRAVPVPAGCPAAATASGWAAVDVAAATVAAARAVDRHQGPDRRPCRGRGRPGRLDLRLRLGRQRSRTDTDADADADRRRDDSTRHRHRNVIAISRPPPRSRRRHRPLRPPSRRLHRRPGPRPRPVRPTFLPRSKL